MADERVEKALREAEIAKLEAEAARLDAESTRAQLENNDDQASSLKANANAIRDQIAYIVMKAKLAEQAVIKHVWTGEDTYASLAQKYYGSFQEPYWRLIYEHNKEIIGNHPNAIREGLEIEIPPLPDELKK